MATRDLSLKQALSEQLDKLDKSLEVQDASAQMMIFLVQDLLDYAQIKSGKFRTNISKFNICQTIQKVISIQKEQAQR